MLPQSSPLIHVCGIHPGTIDTNIVHNGRLLNKTLLGETQKEQAANLHHLMLTKPTKAAQAIVRGIKKKSKRVRIGIDPNLIDLLARLLSVQYPAFGLPLLRRTVSSSAWPPGRQRAAGGGPASIASRPFHDHIGHLAAGVGVKPVSN